MAHGHAGKSTQKQQKYKQATLSAFRCMLRGARGPDVGAAQRRAPPRSQAKRITTREDKNGTNTHRATATSSKRHGEQQQLRKLGAYRELEAVEPQSLPPPRHVVLDLLSRRGGENG